MGWRYRFYRFADRDAYAAAPPPGEAELVASALPDDPGVYLAAAWRGEPAGDPAWMAAAIEAPAAGMAVFAGWDTPMPTPRQITPLAFMEDLFTEAEQDALAAAALASSALFLWWSKMTAASEVDLDDARTVAGLDALVAAGLLPPARRDRVLAGLPPL